MMSLLLLYSCTTRHCVEYASQVAYVAFKPDGAEVSVAGLAGWDHITCGEQPPGNGFEVFYSRAEGLTIDNLYLPGAPDFPEGALYLATMPEAPLGFDVSLGRTETLPRSLQVSHPAADFLVRLESTDPDSMYSRNDLLLSIVDVDSGEVLDDVLLY